MTRIMWKPLLITAVFTVAIIAAILRSALAEFARETRKPE